MIAALVSSHDCEYTYKPHSFDYEARPKTKTAISCSSMEIELCFFDFVLIFLKQTVFKLFSTVSFLTSASHCDAGCDCNVLCGVFFTLSPGYLFPM